MHSPLRSKRLAGLSIVPVLLAGCAIALILGGIQPGGAAGQQYTVPPQTLPALQPFPIVRFVGRATLRGAAISKLTVRATVGTLILTSCRGKRCPFTKTVKAIDGTVGATRTVHVPRLEHVYRAGVTLRLYVVKANFTGKYTSFRIRRNREPSRYDRCVSGLNVKPITCPSN